MNNNKNETQNLKEETKSNNNNIYKINNKEIKENKKVFKSKDLPFKYNCIKSMKPYKVEITCMLFLKSANIIITSSLDPELEVWSFNPEDINLKLLSILEGHTMGVICLKEFSNLNCIASCSKDNTLKLWDIYKKICLKTFYYSLSSILTCCYNPKYNMEIYTAGTNEDITVWGGAAFPLNYNYIPKFKFDGCLTGINILDFIDEFDILVACGRGGSVKFFDWNNKYYCVEEIYFGKEILNAKYFKKRFLISCKDGNIHFVNMNVLKLEKSIQFGKVLILDFQVINNEKYLLMGCSDGNIRLWEIGTQNRTIMKGHNKDVIGVGVTDLNNKYVISASKDNTIKIWKKEEER